MFQYLLKRILYFILTFFIISFFTFGLSKIAPGDPVKLALGSSDSGSGQMAEKMAGDEAYRQQSEKMGMNLPVFYFSLSSAAVPDTLHRILKVNEREVLSRLIDDYGNWPLIEKYYWAIKDVEIGLFSVTQDSSNFAAYADVRGGVNILLQEHKDNRVQAVLDKMKLALEKPGMSGVSEQVNSLIATYNKVVSEPTTGKNLIPSFHWFGTKNQYHNWMFGSAAWFGKKALDASYGFLRFDYGDSYQDKRPVASIIKDAIRWTLTLNIISVLIAYLISIPLGVNTAVKKDSTFDRVSTVTLFALYSLPTFWVATILIVFFTTSEYSPYLDWFPTFGLSSAGLSEDASMWTRFWDTAHHLVLPVFCITYGSFAYLSRQMRGGALSVLRMDYIRTAKAKGLDQNTIIWKHVFRNSLIPIITLFAYLFPAAISGSVVIEVIFSIPGMGKLAFEAISARNYPIVFTVVMFSAVLTMVGNLVADMLYSVVDPRISFTKKA